MQMNIELKGKRALVTGGGSGIGKAVSLRLAEAGADVAVHYNGSEKEALETAEAIRRMGRRTTAVQADLTVAAEASRLVDEAEGALGGTIDIVVNNAGHLVRRCPNADMTEELYAAIMDVNFKSAVFVCKKVIPGMIGNGWGRIVNMSSVAAHNGGGPGAAIYAASKAAVMAYTKGLAKELAPAGIRANAVSPGFIGNTAFHATFTSEEGRQATIRSIPMGREGTPDDVAGAVLFLVSDLSAYLTGETIEINGGMFMR
jgi:3-oxoacyl-[acyl-carrier protein] reductase